MDHDIKREVENIPIPPGLQQRSSRGIQQAKIELEKSKAYKGASFQKRRKSLFIASAIGIVLFSAVVFHTQALAGLQKALQFLPGIGTVLEEDNPMERYVLQKPVTVDMLGGQVMITGMVVENEMTYMTLSGNGGKRFSSIQVINDQGVEYDFVSSMASWTPDEWAETFWYQGKTELAGEIRIVFNSNPETAVSLVLDKAETYESYQALGETEIVNDVVITAITDKVGDKARLSLVSQHHEPFRIEDYGIFGIHEDQRLTVVDGTGKTYELEKPMGQYNPAREFFFELSDNDEEKYTLTIPEINVIYPDKFKVTLDIPAGVESAAFNETFELAGFPVTITNLERIGSDQLRVYVELAYNEDSPRSLHNLRIEQMSHSAKRNDQTNVVEYLQFAIEPGSKKVKLTLGQPEVVIRGPWIFDLASEQFEGN